MRDIKATELQAIQGQSSLLESAAFTLEWAKCQLNDNKDVVAGFLTAASILAISVYTYKKIYKMAYPNY